jgi:kynureninase
VQSLQSLEDAEALDRADPLAPLRARFSLPEGVVYLDGNSLGALPAAAAPRMAEAVKREWGQGLIRSWNTEDWIGAPTRIGAKIASLIGAQPDEVIVADSTSVNLFKLLAAAVGWDRRRQVVVAERGEFPTDLYMVQGLAQIAPEVTLRLAPPGQAAAHLDDAVAAVLLSHVHFKTAERRDMAAVTADVQASGALMIWDLSHSAGAIPVDLNGAGVDLAVGCGYKFLNGGPGAPAYMFVARRWQNRLTSPLAGWMGHAAPFDFVDAYRPAPGLERFLCGTPPMLSLLTLEVGVDIARAAPLSALAAKSAALFDLFAARMQQRLAGLGFTLLCPTDASRRGSHIAYSHPQAYGVMQALIARGVIGDFRDPDILRFGLTPLYVGFADIWRAVETLAQVMETKAWREAPPRARVT